MNITEHIFITSIPILIFIVKIRNCVSSFFNLILISGPKGDPCSKLSCPRYAHCKATFDGNSASCHCPDICAANTLSEDTMVCGKYFKHELFLC